MPQCTTRTTLTLLVGLMLCATMSVAEELPSAESILERYVEVTGGKAAYEAAKNREIKGKLSMPAQGIEGAITIWQSPPANSLTKVTMEGLGDFLEGTNGEVAWGKNPMVGPRVAEGSEKAQTLRRSTFNSELHWKELYTSVETVGKADVDGTPAYQIKLNQMEGKPITQYYAVDSGLLIKQEVTVDTAMGEISQTVTFEDYRDAGGIKAAHTITAANSMGTSQIVAIEEVRVNVDMPADRFALPDDIKALIAAPAAAAATAEAAGGN